MDMKEICILLLFSLCIVLSCGTSPQLAETVTAPESGYQSQTQVQTVTAEPEVPIVVQAEKPEEKSFDPDSISKEVFDAAMTDIQSLIDNLNRIIRARNYSAWSGYLADSYLKTISSRDFLDERTEELYRRDQVVGSNTGRDPRQVQKRLLRTSRDYFNNVVVPSRSNDKLDDIAFISENRVKAYTFDSRGNRLILYDLETIDNKWKIIQ